MFEKYEKEIELIAMQGEKGEIIFKYNRLFNRLIIKTYFRNKLVSRKIEKVDCESKYKILECAMKDKVSNFTQFSGIGLPIYALDNANNIISGKLAKSFLLSISTDDKVEKIIVKDKLKNT